MAKVEYIYIYIYICTYESGQKQSQKGRRRRHWRGGYEIRSGGLKYRKARASKKRVGDREKSNSERVGVGEGKESDLVNERKVRNEKLPK